MFKEDLQKANIEEETLAKKLMELNDYSGYELGDNSDYDIKIFEPTSSGVKTKTYELKHDKHPSNNVAIEIMCLNREKLTGIYVTKADWFVILKWNKYHFIKPEKIKQYIKTHKVKITEGGDNNNAVMALLSREMLNEITVDNSLNKS